MDNQIERVKTALAGRYIIERELGSGGMATVYLAEDVRHHREVAVKVLRPELAAVLGTDRFLHEIEVAARLNHPHILPLHDSGEADGVLFYVMPVAEGESLRARLDRERQLPIDDAIRLTQQIASALDHAHRKGVIHRDIKPENVLLHEGEAMVTDFGIALAVSEAGGTRLTETGLSMGTPHYMSPEQAAGERELDARSDVYALGCVLFEMLAGEPPFTGNTAQSVIAKRITEAAPRVSTLRDTVPATVADNLARALARSPADRFTSAASFASALVADTSGGTAATWSRPVAATGLFGLASLVILLGVYLVTQRLGLPDWILWAAIALLVIGLPVIVATALTERRTDRAAEQPHKLLNWKTALQGGGLAFAGLGIFTVVLLGLGSVGIGPASTLLTKGVLDARDPILLVDFVNRTTDTTLATTLTELFRIDLSQSRVVRLMEPAAITAAMRRMQASEESPLNEELARQVAEREGVKAVMVGEVSSLGSGFVLTARLVAPTSGAVLGSTRATASDETDLISAVDDLSEGLRKQIGESLRDVRASPQLERVTTSSLAALSKYTEAISAAAIASGADLQLLEDAVALDTTFAMAYRRLGIVLLRRGRNEASEAAVRRAFELRDRLAETERYVVMGLFYSSVEYDSAGVESAYRSALAFDPENVPALINLGVHQMFARNWAVRESLVSRAMDVTDADQSGRLRFIVYLNAFNNKLLLGNLAGADSLIRRFARGGDEPVNWRFRWEIARRDYDRAETELRGRTPAGVGFADPAADLGLLGGLLWLRGRLREAGLMFQDEMSRLAASSSQYFDMLYYLALIETDHGVGSGALQMLEADAIESLPAADRRHLQRAELYAGTGQVDRAKRLVTRYEASRDEVYLRQPTRRAELHRATGEIALAEGRYGDAVEDFTVVHALSGQCSTCGLVRLARALLLNDQIDSALVVFERLVTEPVLALYDDDARWLPTTYRHLGELYEERGDNERAIRYYNEFVELWKDADPELQPEVEDLRRRIANLIGEAGARRSVR